MFKIFFKTIKILFNSQPYNFTPTTRTAVDEKIDYLESMQKLEVKDGDILVLRHTGILSPAGADGIRYAVKKIIKDSGFDVKVLILEEGMKIGVLRKEEVKP
jgi:argonaute-like protein implicated in RNA metabolism and viral defense